VGRCCPESAKEAPWAGKGPRPGESGLGRRRGALALAGALGLLGSLAGGPSPARAVSPAPEATASQPGGDDVSVMGAEDSEPTNLTNQPGHDKKPAWSPDGSRIALPRAVGLTKAMRLTTRAATTSPLGTGRRRTTGESGRRIPNRAFGGGGGHPARSGRP
jgi:dipeptidyl aminopeptidase/acylaminoacyl peptidase